MRFIPCSRLPLFLQAFVSYCMYIIQAIGIKEKLSLFVNDVTLLSRDNRCDDWHGDCHAAVGVSVQPRLRRRMELHLLYIR